MDLTPFWLIWIGYFVFVEGLAIYQNIKRRREDPNYVGETLSAHVWAWFGTSKQHKLGANLWGWLRRAALLLFLLWLMIHFMLGGRIV